MEKKLNIYFDYTCPYCYRGIMDFLELLPDYPDLTAEWIPCEAHPLPEAAWIHSNTASQAMLAVAEYGGSPAGFNKAVFRACFEEKQRIDEPEVLMKIADACGADVAKVALALESGKYRQEVLNNNVLVWDLMRLEAVPSYQSGRKMLASKEDVMIPKKQLKAFLDSL